MEQQGFSVDGCPLGVMLAEHACGRQYRRALISAAQAMQAGNPDSINRAIQSSRSYTNLLHLHIQKEDNYLFPMVENVIPGDQKDELLEGFEKVEEVEVGVDTHNRYLALAEALETEIKTYA